ncbi:metallophosphoesterase [Oerskovia sp. M15]
MLGAARRRELTTTLAPRTWEITASVVLVALVAASLSSSTNDLERNPTIPTSTVFAGTLSRVPGSPDGSPASSTPTGHGGQLPAGERRVLRHGRQEPGRRLGRARRDRRGRGRERPVGRHRRGWYGRRADRREHGRRRPGPGSAGDREPTGLPSPASSPGSPSTSSPAEDAELVTMLLISDLHCNIGMAPLIRTAIERSGATLVLNAGDTTMNGTAVENFCVDAYMSALPKGTTMVVADGNHDSTETSARERSRGAKVLSGKILDIQGIRILGDSDAMAPGLIEGPTVRGEGPIAQAERLTEVACEAEDGIDILLIHTPRVGNARWSPAACPSSSPVTCTPAPTRSRSGRASAT